MLTCALLKVDDKFIPWGVKSIESIPAKVYSASRFFRARRVDNPLYFFFFAFPRPHHLIQGSEAAPGP